MRKPQPTRPATARTDGTSPQRCAIYTRKSSEEGLEQEFNSLNAQREACEAFIRSQKQAGWVALPIAYDDGGISGGTLERPALQRLLSDVQAGRIDTVVVYKVDRLTRSLSDFAKIVDAFDAKGVSFVSVTQQFNTTSSMGRLTLNMLLSFARFEREVTGERIRDKIAASKQKGMWMGGLPPLGYDVAKRKLVINPAEADTVRHIFRRYLDLRSVNCLQQELNAAEVMSKTRTDRLGRATGGKPITRGALYLMLQNRLYRGEIAHKGQHYPGQHEAIIDAALWDQVQAALAENRIERTTGAHATTRSMLAGLVYDQGGERMSPTHANKNGTRYRYYVSHSLITASRAKAPVTACRVPAADLEATVEDRIRALLRDEAAIYDLGHAGSLGAMRSKALIARAAALATTWPELAASRKRSILHAFVTRIVVGAETVEIALRSDRLIKMLETDLDAAEALPSPSSSGGPVTILSAAVRLRRVGAETTLMIEGPSSRGARDPDRSLLRLLGQARRFQDRVLTGQGKTFTELAAELGVTSSYFTRVFRLGFLAPAITQAIMRGQHPAELTANKLILTGKLALTWSEQQRQLGFA